jgi:hypothetical protein
MRIGKRNKYSEKTCHSATLFITNPTWPALGKSPCHPLGMRQGGPQRQSGCCGEEKNLLPLPRDQTLAVQHVAHHHFSSM